jgi:hypothetical protein
LDSFEEFEFKPITEGLGFHKKNQDNKPNSRLSPNQFFQEEIKSEAIPSKKVDFELPELKLENNFEKELTTESFSKKKNTIFSQQPLPRNEDIVKSKIDIPKFQGPRLNKIEVKSTASNTPKVEAPKADLSKVESAKVITSNKISNEIKYQYKEVAPSFLSVFLDSTLILGLSILFTLGLVLATGIDIVKVFSSNLDLGAQIGIFLLIFSVSQLYYILSRVFFGQTLGEWSLDHQLGEPKDQERISYVFKLFFRAIVIASTGLVILPIISALTGKDIAGRLSALLMNKKEQV